MYRFSFSVSQNNQNGEINMKYLFVNIAHLCNMLKYFTFCVMEILYILYEFPK